MKVNQSLMILLGLLLMTGTIVSSQQTPAFTFTNPDFEGICTAADRGSRPCTREIAQGCRCYNNGTCFETGVNKCADCSRDNVFSVTLGACPKVQPALCPPTNPAISLMCTKELYEACVCTTDGKCSVRYANKCSDCQNENILAIFRGDKCPADNLQKKVNSDDEFTPKKCPNYNGALVKCSTTPEPGCACYKDGTCKYVTDGNTCTLCAVKDTKVVSFNPGEKCPVIPGTPKEVICTKESRNPDRMCIAAILEVGCATLKDGTTKTVSINACTCQDPNIIKYTPGKKCPAVPESPKEVVCTKKSRNQDRMYIAAILEVGCATLKDGTTKTVSVNACTCQDPNIIKYIPGKECPVRPTKPHHNHSHHHHHSKSRDVHQHKSTHRNSKDQCEKFWSKFQHERVSRSILKLAKRTRRYSFCKNRSIW